PSFSEDRATSDHELVWLVQNGAAKVFLPKGRLAGKEDAVKPSHAAILMRMMLSKDLVIVESGSHRLYAGKNELDVTKPRYLGIRFLRSGNEKGENVIVQSVRVVKP